MARYRLTRPHFIDGFILLQGAIVETNSPGEHMVPIDVEAPSDVEEPEPVPSIQDVLQQLNPVSEPLEQEEPPKATSLAENVKNAVSFIFQGKKD